MIGTNIVRSVSGAAAAGVAALSIALAAATGAGLVGFSQAGTGAVARTAEAKMREVAVTPQDFGAVADGVADDTAAFEKARDAAGIGGRVVVPPGTYKLNAAALSVARQHWSFAKTATFRSASKLTAPALNVTAAGVTIEGGVCDNQAASTDAFAMVGCVHVTDAAEVTITGGTYKAAVGPLVYAQGTSRLRVLNNDFSDTWYAAVFIRPTTADIADIEVTGNRIVNTAAFTGYKFGIDVHTDVGMLYKVSGVNIGGNLIRFPTTTLQTPLGIELYGGKNDGTPVNGPGKIENASVHGNTTYGGGMGISLSHVVDTTASGNSVLTAKKYGIEVVEPYAATVVGNTVNGPEIGVSLSVPGVGVTVSGNAIRGTTVAGVYASSIGKGMAVSNNNISATSGAGVYVLSSQRFSITGNTLEGNSTGNRAVMLDKSDVCSISGNVGSNWTAAGVFIYGDAAQTLNRINASGNVWVGTVNSLTMSTQLSNGAAIGQFVSYVGNFSDTDTSYRRDYYDILNNRVHFVGGGTPEGAFSAGLGSTYLRTDAPGGLRLYVKESGTGNTGWVAK